MLRHDPAFRDLDTEGDGIAEAVGGALNSDADSLRNFVDADGDGVPYKDR